jgi:hypothetical protein
MAELTSKKINIYQELRAQRAEMTRLGHGREQDDRDEELLLDCWWLRASVACALISFTLSACQRPDGDIRWWTTIATAGRVPVGFSAVVCLAMWTGLVAEAKGQSRVRCTLWALVTPVFTSILVINARSLGERGRRTPDPQPDPRSGPLIVRLVERPGSPVLVSPATICTVHEAAISTVHGAARRGLRPPDTCRDPSPPIVRPAPS